ncbi:hypothetical protein HAT2_00723 [Candidatus Similichlamydia laticola]|uniref:General secretion pathway protein J n=2 Tax=Candidatus Similichlamydia laticola TaxID=2170265 RepID=A0A369KER0_9BACT|nr:hypothetical protein HAT2_00723 [Candidatus Similichlamydia laticola]
MALFGMLLSVMTGTFFQLYRANFVFQEVEKRLLEAHLFDSFIRELIESTYAPLPTNQNLSSDDYRLLPRTLWTDDQGASLSFLYAPQEDHPPEFSTHVQAKLSVDRGRLRLERRPYSPHAGFGTSVRTTYFFQKVSSIQFRFYCGFHPSEEWEIEGEERQPPFEVSTWSSSHPILPTSVLLTIKMESGAKEEFSYRFRAVPLVLHYE